MSPGEPSRTSAPASPRAGRRPALSVIVITLDEEENLGRALESVRWADEIVVVDSESTDGTERVARRYTDRFVVRPWKGQGRQKQRALELARGEWVLSLDADEEVTPELRRSIEAAVRDPGGRAGFEVGVHSYYLGHWFGRRGWRREDWKLRLFRRDRGRFSDHVIHEHARVDGPVGRLDGPLLHYPYRDMHDHIARMNRYTTHIARERHRRGERRGVVSPFLRGGAEFLSNYLLRGGFLDGRSGLMGAGFAGMYTFLKHAKIWELGLPASGADPPSPAPSPRSSR